MKKCALLIAANNVGYMIEHIEIEDCPDAATAYKRVVSLASGIDILNNRLGLTTYNFRLDENTAERLNTNHLVFISPTAPISGHHWLPCGRSRANGPVVVTTSKFGGFKDCERASRSVIYVVESSMPDTEVKNPLTLDELFKAHGNK